MELYSNNRALRKRHAPKEAKILSNEAKSVMSTCRALLPSAGPTMPDASN